MKSLTREKRRFIVEEKKLLPGQAVLVRNSDKEEWKIKIFATDDATANGWSNYHINRPFKVHNKTNTKRMFSFKQCVPFPTGLVPVA